MATPAKRNITAPRLAFFRPLAAFLALALGILTVSAAQAAADTAQRIAAHFSSVRTMTGEFVQFGPRGEQTGGKFYIERPGKLRFDYEGSSGFRVVSDGTSVVVRNKRMNTADVYPLSQTPLKLLLDERIDLSGEKVQSVQQDEDLTTVKLADRKVFGSSTITMMFDASTYQLRQWTITDAQGKDTTVMIYNVQEGVTFDPSVFAIDYRRVNELNRGR
ncbi:outer membrane lipoprotein carrier protein LolA [Chelativorans salis]|uniref:Outer membrane lipoprotein carrier protein LolA n=1 Tax=Chelativorans salis TaxID=2978478 RepID=A0ABT2LS41_9HYPH|nr:outer membrane lipoprotein carrier protein LolA [Chelativorans sp. EGI FJ00035]MCT7376453.1 outer membrane lipoprotein carrier protein LolA [Chelativorans sp. EGI FJ00035]